MRRRSSIVAVAVAVCLPLAATATASGKEAMDVLVTNTADNPVPATIVGTPTVNVGNRPALYQKHLTLTTDVDGLFCSEVPQVPGATVAVTNAALFAINGVPSQAFLRSRSPGHVVPGVPIELVGTSVAVRGQVQTLQYFGTVDGALHRLDICTTGEPGMDLRVVLSGVVHPS